MLLQSHLMTPFQLTVIQIALEINDLKMIKMGVRKTLAVYAKERCPVVKGCEQRFKVTSGLKFALAIFC